MFMGSFNIQTMFSTLDGTGVKVFNGLYLPYGKNTVNYSLNGPYYDPKHNGYFSFDMDFKAVLVALFIMIATFVGMKKLPEAKTPQEWLE